MHPSYLEKDAASVSWVLTQEGRGSGVDSINKVYTKTWTLWNVLIYTEEGKALLNVGSSG